MDNIEIATDVNDEKYDGVTYTFKDVVTKIFSLSSEHIRNLTNYKENQSWIYFKYPYYRILMKSFRRIGSDIELPDEVFPKSATLFKKYQGKKSTFTEQYNLKSVSCSMYMMLFLEHCYDLDSSFRVFSIFDSCYKILHYEDSRKHCIDHTKIFSDTIFEKACFLMDCLFDFQYESISQNATVKRKLCLVLGRTLIFYGVVLLLEKVGLYPFRPKVPWEANNRDPPDQYDLFSFLLYCKSHTEAKEDYRRKTHGSFMQLFSASTYPVQYDDFIVSDFGKNVIKWCNHMLDRYEEEYYKVLLVIDVDEDYADVVDDDLFEDDKTARQVAIRGVKRPATTNSPIKRSCKKQKSKSLAKNKVLTFKFVLKPFNKSHSRRGGGFCIECQKNKKGNRLPIAVITNLKNNNEKYVCKYHATTAWIKHIFNESMKDSTDGKGMLTYLDVIYIKQTRDPSALLRNICISKDLVCAVSGRCDENKAMAIECPANCKRGSKCTNQHVRMLRQHVESEIVRAEILSQEKGAGLLSNVDIKKGDLIIEYVGTLERLDNCLKSLKEKLKFGDRGIYFAKIPNTSYCIDAEIYGNDSRSINHSCNPNSMLKQWVVSLYCNFRCMYIFYI